MKAFISYSHKDERILERLHTHLVMLRRDGQLNDWYDREILAGGDLDQEISEHLESSDLFLALVSPDFLASDYCYDNEMMRALERHEAGQMRVIPIIIEPCDWKASPLKKLKALPRDGEPITEWTNENNAFLDIVEELRRILSSDNAAQPATTVTPSTRSVSESHRYRIKRDFDEIDRSDFRDNAFKEIQSYFESSIAEIDIIEGLRGRLVDVGPQNFTCTVVNQRMSRGAAHITVNARNSNMGFADIYYSFSENAPLNTANGGFSIEADEYDLFLRPHMFFISDQDKKLTPQQAAELLWSEFIKQAGVSYD